MAIASRQNSQRDSRKGGNAGKVILVIAVIIVIAVLVGIIIFLLLGRRQPEEAEKRNVVVTQDNIDEVVANMEETEFIAPGYFETSMTNEWHFSSGKAVSEDAYVANVANNTNDVYFDVVLASDESQIIYSSPVIPIGASLEGIALDTPLESGTYDCVMIYHLVDEDQNSISTLRVTITIVVEN
mgnify:CR=1 FL=1